MRLSSKTLTIILNLLLGAAWAATLIGAVSALMRYSASQGWLYALATMLIWALPGLVSIVLLEYLIRGFERHEEALRQSRLLKEILHELRKRRSE